MSGCNLQHLRSACPPKLCSTFQCSGFIYMMAVFSQHFHEVLCCCLVTIFIFSLTNLLPSAVMFDFLREPSFLPIVPISVYFLRNLRIPCLVSGRFSFAKILAKVGAWNPISKKTHPVSLLLPCYTLQNPTESSSLHIHNCTQCIQLLSNTVCNFARSKPQLCSNLARSSQSTNFTW